MSRAVSRAQRLQRIEELLLAVPRGLTTGEIARRLGVHRSTIWRDMQDLTDHVPIFQDGDRYNIDRTSYLTNVRLNIGESLMLHLAVRVMIRRMTHIPPIMLAALEKLTLALRDPVTSQLEESLHRLRSERQPDSDRAHVWEVLVRGWLEQVTVRFVYQKFQSEHPKQYEIQPYLFEPALLSEGVYVLGHSPAHGDLRTFKVERILRANLTTQHFERPENFDVDQLLQHAWGIWYGEDLTEVRLRFRDPPVARRVRETLWHPSQHIHELPDGGVDWTVRIAGMTELIPWIRGWGPDCEVLAPADLRDLIAADMRQAAELYQG